MVGLSQKRLKQRRLHTRRDRVKCRPSGPCLSFQHLVTEAAPPHPTPTPKRCSVKQTQKQATSPYPPFPGAQGGSPGKRDPTARSPATTQVTVCVGGGVLSVTPIAEMTMLLCVYRTPSRAPRGTFPRADPGLASCVHSASSADDQREPRHCNFWARHPSQLKQDKRPAQPEHVQPSTGHASHSHLVLLQSPTLE